MSSNLLGVYKCEGVDKGLVVVSEDLQILGPLVHSSFLAQRPLCNIYGTAPNV